MADDESKGKKQQRGRGNLKSSLLTRFLTPIAAAAASAAAGWAAKKAPDFFETKVLPRLRSIDTNTVSGAVTHDLPAKAASVASGAGDVAHDLGERAKSLVSSGSPASNGNSGDASLKDLEKRRNERARSRAERRQGKAR